VDVLKADDRMNLERLEITPFAILVAEVLQQRRTGRLTIVHTTMRKILHWSQGELVLLTSHAPDDSLAAFLLQRHAIDSAAAASIAAGDPTDAVERFHETGARELSWRQTLLREWLASQFVPLFSLDQGTAVFEEETALAPEKRVFLQSTAVLVLDGIRAITNGLVLRRSLGDIKRDIAPSRDSRLNVDTIPLTDAERRIATSLTSMTSIEAFLKHFPGDSLTAAKVVIALLTLGVFEVVDFQTRRDEEILDAASMQRDMELLAAIGSNDPRSLRAVALSRQLPSLDHYHVLDVPRAATRAQITAAGDRLKRLYDASTYPPAARPSVQAIADRIDDATKTLSDPVRRQAYDKLGADGGSAHLQQRATQRSIAEQNFTRARDLAVDGDYYGAIILLKQAVHFAPDLADAWYLLGTCQERNPKWRRDAAESMQRALAVDPNHIDAMISLGDVYRAEGLASRAQTCYEDVLKIAPENSQAKSRLAALRKK
jgi:tetratricopeptide (TPR) repeat protein